MSRRRFVVTGRVQGVFFRQATRDVAVQLGIAGTAVNRADGKVEVVAEGDDDALDALAAFLREGPPRALVTKVDVLVEQPEGLTGFRTG